MAQAQQWIDACSPDQRQAVYAAACSVAYADGRLWREAPLLKSIARAMGLPRRMARRIQNQVADGRIGISRPDSEPARRLMFHYGLQVACSDGRVAEPERKLAGQLGAALGIAPGAVDRELAAVPLAVQPGRAAARAVAPPRGGQGLSELLAGLTGGPVARPAALADRLAVGLLVAANLLPLGGVLVLGWDAAAIVMLYWWENVVLGGFNILKIAWLPVEHPAGHAVKLLPIGFFSVHYGGFCAVHGVLLLVLFQIGEPPVPDAGDTWWGPLVFLQLLAGVVGEMWRKMALGAGWALVALVVSHGVSFVQNYLVGGEFRRVTIDRLMISPYGRIVVLHVAIIFGGMFVMLLGSPLLLLVIFIGLKTVMDLHFHRRGHRRLGPARG